MMKSCNSRRSIMTALTAAMLFTGMIPAQATQPVTIKEISENYANIAHAGYGDSLLTAQRLKNAVATLVAQPSKTTLQAARTAWKAARVPYQQTEAFRFGNKLVDDWEGKVNAWPLDEGLIDYVASSYQ